MTRAAAPDLEAFCALQFPRLVRMLDLFTGDVHIAEELAQEALIRTASRWDRVRTMDRPDAWTRRVARNLATSRWRRLQAARRAAARTGPDPTTHTDVDVAATQDLRDAMQRLSLADREVLVLRHHLGMTNAEVAVELGLSESAVKSRSARAAGRLRALLDPSTSTEEVAR